MSNEGFEDCSCHHINSDTYWESFCSQLKRVCQSYSSCWLWTACKRILRWMNCMWSCVFFLFLNGLMKILKKKQNNQYGQEWIHAANWWSTKPQLPIEATILLQIFYTCSSMSSIQWPRYFLEVSLSNCITLVDMKTGSITDAFPYSLLKPPDDIFTWQKF